jgi:hypothetical protein
MRNERVKSKKFQGVYFRLSTERKHLGKPDKTFWITWTEHGKKQWENVGNASLGITEEYAYQRRIKILGKLGTGGIQDIRAKRQSLSLEEVMAAYLDWKAAEGKRVDSDLSRHAKDVRPFFGNIPIQKSFRAEGLVISPDFIELLTRISHDFTGFAHVSQIGRKL